MARLKTSGVGAWAGMLMGATFGLPFGPLGVLIGGFVGLFIGNQLEYEALLKQQKNEVR